MVVSIGLTLALLTLQYRVIKATGSAAIRADSLHYRSDLLLNASILVALTLAYFGWQQLDAYFGLGIAVYILWSALQIARETVSVLMDEELPTDVSARMLELACSVPGYSAPMICARGFPVIAGLCRCTWSCRERSPYRWPTRSATGWPTPFIGRSAGARRPSGSRHENRRLTDPGQTGAHRPAIHVHHLRRRLA